MDGGREGVRKGGGKERERGMKVNSDKMRDEMNKQYCKIKRGEVRRS